MKKTVYKKLVAVMLAITFAAATFGLKGNIKEVNAEENDAEPYYLIGLCGNYDDEYAFNSCGLFASDFDSTTLISKLDDTQTINSSEQNAYVRNDKSTTLKNFDGLKSMNEFISGFENKKQVKRPVMRELARKLQSC